MPNAPQKSSMFLVTRIRELEFANAAQKFEKSANAASKNVVFSPQRTIPKEFVRQV